MRRNRSFCYRRRRGEDPSADIAVCLVYNLFLITLTIGVFICLQVILYKRNHLLSIDVLYIHTHFKVSNYQRYFKTTIKNV